MSVGLWALNKWLRWTGFRVAVTLDDSDEPTRLGLYWYGLYGSAGWNRIEGL